MRKITIEAINAFMNNKPFARSSTIVTKINELMVLYLHGNRIATKCINTNKIKITNAGWFTVTTKERLNGLPNVSIRQKKGKWYLNGELWDGSWTEIK